MPHKQSLSSLREKLTDSEHRSRSREIGNNADNSESKSGALDHSDCAVDRIKWHHLDIMA